MIGFVRKRFGKTTTIGQLPVFGGGLREPVVSPYARRSAISRLTALSMVVKTAAVGLIIMALPLTIWAVSVMRESVHIADGSRFGCIITPIEDLPASTSNSEEAQ